MIINRPYVTGHHCVFADFNPLTPTVAVWVVQLYSILCQIG